MDEFEYPVSLHVHVTDPAQMTHVAEVLSRTAAGLAMEGLHASVHIDRYEHDHEDEDVQP